MTYRLLAPALDDMEHIDAWVASNFGESVATKVADGLYEVFELLAEFQGMGILRPDITDEPSASSAMAQTGSSMSRATRFSSTASIRRRRT
jgi:plasmid stabilization system protein ParE